MTLRLTNKSDETIELRPNETITLKDFQRDKHRVLAGYTKIIEIEGFEYGY